MTRRSFLKLGLMGVVPAAMSRLIPGDPVGVMAAPLEPSTLTPALLDAPASLGRIATWWRQAIRKEPAPNAEVVAWMSRDDLLPLHGAVEGAAPWPTNPVWYQTEGGYIHSGYVQPVRDEPQPVVVDVPESGFWGQVSVPWAAARWSLANRATAFKFYYGTVYRVVETALDADGQAWYRLKEGVTDARPGPYVPAYTLRRVAPEELTPISPGHPNKTVLIDRRAQTLACLEGDQAVFSTRVSTGHAGTATPGGEFRVLYKRTTRRMAVSNISDPYDLPGVPFTVYFTWSGVAIHGTYWHNDYGRVHSHGCVNLTPDAAQWVFRWVEPVSPYEVYTMDAEPREVGTRIVVI